MMFDVFLFIVLIVLQTYQSQTLRWLETYCYGTDLVQNYLTKRYLQ